MFGIQFSMNVSDIPGSGMSIVEDIIEYNQKFVSGLNIPEGRIGRI